MGCLRRGEGRRWRVGTRGGVDERGRGPGRGAAAPREGGSGRRGEGTGPGDAVRIWGPPSGGQVTTGGGLSPERSGGGGSALRRGQDRDLVVEEGDPGVRHGFDRGTQAGGEECYKLKRFNDLGYRVWITKLDG